MSELLSAEPERIRVEFDSTLDEVVDANVRLVTHTRSFRRQRTLSQIFAGGSLTVALAAAVVLRGQLAPMALAIVVGVGFVGGLLLGYLYGYFHDWCVRRSYHPIIKEMYRGAETVRCEYELRPDVLWCKTEGTEIAFPWSRLTRVNITESSIELWFDPGLAVVPNRAFHRNEDRRRFIEMLERFSQQNTA